jgi:hypothetical protein
MADSGTLCRQFDGNLGCVGIVAAYDHIVLNIRIPVEHSRGNILEGCRNRNTHGNELSGLLCGRALPDSEGGSAGTSANACGQGNRRINEYAAGTKRRLKLFQQACRAFERVKTSRSVASTAAAFSTPETCA